MDSCHNIPMRRTLPWMFILAMLVPAAAALSHQDSKPAQTKPDAPASAPGAGASQRVILWLNRDQTLPGFVQLEDDQLIAVRNLKGEVESYPKTRVITIVRLVEPQPGQEGVVFLRDGQTREGTIIEDAFDYVLMDIKGIRAKLKRDLVDHVILQPTVDERYAAAKAALQPGNYDAHFALCQWLHR